MFTSICLFLVILFFLSLFLSLFCSFLLFLFSFSFFNVIPPLHSCNHFFSPFIVITSFSPFLLILFQSPFSSFTIIPSSFSIPSPSFSIFFFFFTTFLFFYFSFFFSMISLFLFFSLYFLILISSLSFFLFFTTPHLLLPFPYFTVFWPSVFVSFCSFPANYFMKIKDNYSDNFFCQILLLYNLKKIFPMYSLYILCSFLIILHFKL